MNKQSTLAKNIAKVLSANFLVTIVGFVGSFIFPKILSIEAYATYHIYLLYLGYIAILHLGFPSGMVINYAGIPYTKIDKKQYKAELIILFFILGGFTIIFGTYFLFSGKVMGLYMMLSVIPVCWVGAYKTLTQAWSKFDEYTTLNIIGAVVPPILAIIYYLLFRDLPGEVYIILYIVLNWSIAFYLIIKSIVDLHKVKAASIISKYNFNTEKTGLAISLGNYVNTLFVSSDKQFVNWFFGSEVFAFYSFGMSMQAIMTVFTTSVSQPLFPAMAQGRFKDEGYNDVKSLLFIFGSFSGCAYFVVSFIVKHYITKYTNSLGVVSVYFVVFPAMAVINCLYINLYKIKGLMKKYIFSLVGILCLSILLNTLAILFIKTSIGVAIATTVTYYIWLFVGIRQFEFMSNSVNDMFFLSLYFILYFVVVNSCGDISGLLLYFILVIVIAFCCYRKKITRFMELLGLK